MITAFNKVQRIATRNFNSQKGIVPITAIFILAIILIGGGAYYSKQQAKPASKSNVIDITANWKTYANEKYSFSLKYPMDARIVAVDNYDVPVLGPVNIDKHLIAGIHSIDSNYPRSVTGLYLSEINDKDSCSALSNGQKLIRTKNIDGVIFSMYGENVSNDAMGGIRSLNDEYQFVHNGTCFFVESSVFWKDVSYDLTVKKPTAQELEEQQNWIQTQQQLNNQILSTFKFADQDQVDATANWKTYTNDKYGFEFKYPLDLWINDFTIQGSVGKTVPPFLNLSADNIYTVGDADGVCGTTSPDVYQKQKLVFDKAKNEDSFDDGFNITDRNVKFSKIIINDSDEKFAYGISLCRGRVQENDPGALSFIAVAFNGNTRISFYFPTGNLPGEKVKNMNEVANQISNNVYKGEAQNNYNNLLKILSTFKFTDQASTPTQKQEVFDDGSTPTTWAVAGISDPQDFKNFFVNFQQLVKKDQKSEIAKLIRYPLKDIKNEADFVKNYDQVLTQKVKTAVINQNVEQMFRNYQGVMVGNGEIWFHSIAGKSGYWIIAINN